MDEGTVHSMKLTPDLRAKAKEGFELFQAAPLAAPMTLENKELQDMHGMARGGPVNYPLKGVRDSATVTGLPPEVRGPVLDALTLMDKSTYHRTWSEKDVRDLVIPPIKLGQYYLLHDDRDGEPDGFLTWGLFPKAASEGYAKGNRRLKPEDWNAGDDLWFITFVAPHGNMKILRDKFRALALRDKLPLPGRFIRPGRKPRTVAWTRGLVDAGM